MGMFKKDKDEALIAQGYELGIEHAKRAVTVVASHEYTDEGREAVKKVGLAIQERAEQQADKWYPG